MAGSYSLNGEKNSSRTRTIILALLVSTALLSSALIVEAGVQKVYAAKGGNGGKGGGGGNSSDNGDKGKSQDKGQSDKTSSSAAVNEDDEDDSKNHNGGAKDNSSGKEKSQQENSDEEKKQNNTSLAKSQKYKPHKLNETATWSDGANMTYSLEAGGIAKAIGKSNSTANATAGAELSVEMSVWKTTKSLVSMDITNGTITVDGKTMEFYSGQVNYMPSKHKMLLAGFITESRDDGAGENQTTIDTGVDNQTFTNQTSLEVVGTNQTSTDTGINQTSTEIPYGTDTDEESGDELVLRHVKLWMRVGEGGSSPSDSMTVTVLSPQSKISSEWFLQMSGEFYASP